MNETEQKSQYMETKINNSIRKNHKTEKSKNISTNQTSRLLNTSSIISVMH